MNAETRERGAAEGHAALPQSSRTVVLIGANEEERGWLLRYMAAAGNLYAYTPFSLKVLGITLDI